MAHWNAEEQKTMKSNIHDGMQVIDLVKLFPARTAAAVIRQVQKFNFGIKTVNGDMFFYENKRTRNRKKRNEEARTAVTVQEPKSISKQTTRYAFGKIIPDSNECSHGTTLKFIYDDINKLLSSTKYSHIESVTVTLENIAITVSKGSS